MNTQPGERLGAGRGAEVFAWGEGRVLKLLFDASNNPWLERELLAQRAAVAAGIRAPEAFELVEHDGRPGLVMARIDGTDGLSAAEKQPWRIWALGRRSGALHRSISTVQAPEQVPSFVDAARRVIESSDRVPERARARVLAVLEPLPDGGELCHMDFHLGNVLEGPGGLTVIDFASAHRADWVADHVKSLLLLDAGSPPEMSAWQRAVVLFGRKLARAAYVRGYGRLSRGESDRANRWWPVVIAQRLAEGIPEERKPLLRLLSRKLREAEAVSR